MFEYNKSLIEINNEEVLSLLKQIKKSDVLSLVSKVAEDLLCADTISECFVRPMTDLGRIDFLTEDSVRGFFAITMNGTNVIWESILRKYPFMFNVHTPMFENVLEYIEDLIDETPFNQFVLDYQFAA